MKLMPHDYPGVKPCPKSGPFSRENADKAWRQKLISDCMEKHGLNRRQLAARGGRACDQPDVLAQRPAAAVDALAKERDALAAHAQRLHEILLSKGDDLALFYEARARAVDESPSVSIARRDARIKAAALDDAAQALSDSGHGSAAQVTWIRAGLNRFDEKQ